MATEALAVSISDAELLSRLKDFENTFIERKSRSDSQDWLKTAVAFANSCPIGLPGFMFVGVRNNGTPEPGIDCDALQREITKKLARAYPSIYYLQKVLRFDDAQFVAVIVPGSSNRPHFAGSAYIRVGSETIDSSDEQFRTLIASRNTKAYEIIRHIGDAVLIEQRNTERINVIGAVASAWEGKIIDCSQFVVVIQKVGSDPMAIPLDRILLSRDEARQRLKLEVYQIPLS